jgi:hypothetical protein
MKKEEISERRFTLGVESSAGVEETPGIKLKEK